ncbi:MAG: GNAT family N-acetyltransferase [Synechococcales cyanobacterium CRU_2_2]|nr:GNAT family N-acetyltransferase [Synechococcales cyanobacterium CRU_2_2]
MTLLTQELTLRPTTAADLGFVFESESAPANRRYVIPWTREQHEAALADPNLQHWVVESDRPLGYFILAGLQNPNQSVEMRRIVITAKGRGYGRRAIKLSIGYIFDDLQAHRFWVEVKDFDVRTLHLYRSLGFVEEGKLRESYKSSQGFESLVLLSMLRSEYEQIVA